MNTFLSYSLPQKESRSISINAHNFLLMVDDHIRINDFKGKLNQLFRYIVNIPSSIFICQEDILEKVRNSAVMRPAYYTLKSIFYLTKSELSQLNLMISVQAVYGRNFMAQQTMANFLGTERTRTNKRLKVLRTNVLIWQKNRKDPSCTRKQLSSIYMVNTIFYNPEVRELFKDLLPALKAFSIDKLKNVTVSYEKLYYHQLNILRSIAYEGFLPNSKHLNLLPMMKTLSPDPEIPFFTRKIQADKIMERKNSLNGTMNEQIYVEKDVMSEYTTVRTYTDGRQIVKTRDGKKIMLGSYIQRDQERKRSQEAERQAIIEARALQDKEFSRDIALVEQTLEQPLEVSRKLEIHPLSPDDKLERLSIAGGFLSYNASNPQSLLGTSVPMGRDEVEEQVGVSDDDSITHVDDQSQWEEVY